MILFCFELKKYKNIRTIEETFLIIFYDTDSNENTSSTSYIVSVWVFWFIILIVIVFIVTYLSTLVENARETRKQLFRRLRNKNMKEKNKTSTIDEGLSNPLAINNDFDEMQEPLIAIDP